MFENINLKAEIVNGKCPTCEQETLLVSLTPELFRCITCGSDLRQHINGKISYIPHVNSAKDIKLDFTNTNG
jgi:ribosomal protein S27E